MVLGGKNGIFVASFERTTFKRCGETIHRQQAMKSTVNRRLKRFKREKNSTDSTVMTETHLGVPLEVKKRLGSCGLFHPKNLPFISRLL